jgi:tRNA-splicing ligase RtcB
MGYRAQVTKVGPASYVLPRVGQMRTEVTAFLSEALFEQTDETLWRQAAESASMPGATGMYLMPDTHVGYHIPVGGVLVTEDVIVQAGSGYDISCGVIYLQVDGLHATDVVDFAKRAQWIDAVESRVATGVGTHAPKKMRKPSEKLIQQALRRGASALGIPTHLCERPFIPIPDDVDVEAIPRAYDKARPQLGSVGGGNHFVELQVDRDDGSVWVMVHCGSRGYGWQTANHYFYAGAALRGLPNNRREQSWLHADEPLGKAYWAHHNAAANYAIANRWTIVEALRDATDAVFGATLTPYFEISHNLVQYETLLLPDGSTRRGYVHRKGATRAFPAGHPDLVGTPWADTGHPCLIPGSMYAGAAILFPLAGATRSGCSVNHGSGRVLGRGEAKRELGPLQAEIDREMREVRRSFAGIQIKGIAGNTHNTPLDECGHAYKDLDEVLAVLEEEGIARVERRLYPVANIKGVD